MIRVLHVVVAGDIGGAERLLVDLASRPTESGAEHTVALMTPNPRLADMFSNAGLRLRDRGRVRENPLAYLWRSLGPSDVAWLEGILHDERADMAHLHTFGSHVVGARAAIRAGVPFLRTEHHVEYFVDPSCSAFTRWSLARAKASVAVSQYVSDFISRIAPASSNVIHVVRNGVDADHFAPRPRVGREDAESGRPFKFAVVCRLEPWKGVGLAIEALELMPDAHLDIVGEGSERARLEADVSARGLNSRVKFLGYCSDPRDAVDAADAIVSGSRDEPLGLSVLEALAMARPVVAFASGGIPEIVQDGETGWLVQERSAAALARGMADAASDRARACAYGEAGRLFVEKRCRIEAMCEGYREIYENVLSGTPPSPTVEDNGP